jgi:hypothetical protein
MAKRRRSKMTPEERAQMEAERDETQRMVRERIAYHTAKALAEEERRARKQRRWAPLRPLVGREAGG